MRRTYVYEVFLNKQWLKPLERDYTSGTLIMLATRTVIIHIHSKPIAYTLLNPLGTELCIMTVLEDNLSDRPQV